jgi:SNF2 family DNA or RNA helicase
MASRQSCLQKSWNPLGHEKSTEEQQMNQLQMPIRAAPYAHQREAFEFALSQFDAGQNSTAFLMEMGTGKTLVSIAVAGALHLERRARRALIAAPLSVLGVWGSEFKKFANFPYTLQVLTGSGAQKEQQLNSLCGPGLQVAVCNYEFARDRQKAVLAWQPDIVIADEGHKIKSHTSQTSKALHGIGAAAPYRLLLTGTPVTNKAADIFSQYKFLNPAVFGNSYYVFRNRFFDVGYFASQLALKPSKEAEFTEKLHTVNCCVNCGSHSFTRARTTLTAYRATKAECLDLPAFVDVVRPVELDPQAMKIYHAMMRDFCAEVIHESESCVNEHERSSCSSSLREGKKLVVIAHFVPELHAICTLLEGKNIGHVCVMGGVKNRDELVERFKTDPACAVFVGQIGTAGLGIDLTAASTMVFFSLDYSMSNFEQAKARIHRNGQHHKCTYVYLTARGTVDEKVLQALQDKASLAHQLIDECKIGG